METAQLSSHRIGRGRRPHVAIAIRALCAILVLLGCAGIAQAQTDIRQVRAFEGGAGTIALCNGSPDIGPAFGTTVTAHTGSQFVGFHESLLSTTNQEVFSIPIDRVLANGSSYRYRFMARIAPVNHLTHPAWQQTAGGANSGEIPS